MNRNVREILGELIRRFPSLMAKRSAIEAGYELMRVSYESGGKLLLCGNGGSCADCEHIAGELMKGFLKKRPVDDALRVKLSEYGPEGVMLSEKMQMALPAVALNAPALSSAVINDLGGDLAFAQQLMGLGRPGDVLMGITTSGNARNVRLAAIAARTLGMKVIGLTGEGGGELKMHCDALIDVPESATFRVQEMHLPVYHALCAMLEESFYQQ